MRFRLALTALALLAATACGGGLTDPSNNVTQTFTGTVPHGAGNSSPNSFTVAKNGEFSATLVSMTPALPLVTSPTAILVVTNSSTGCQLTSIIGEQDSSYVGHQALSGIITAGAYCLIVADEGYFTTDETYTVTISHP